MSQAQKDATEKDSSPVHRLNSPSKGSMNVYRGTLL